MRAVNCENILETPTNLHKKIRAHLKYNLKCALLINRMRLIGKKKWNLRNLDSIQILYKTHPEYQSLHPEYLPGAPNLNLCH